MTKAGNHLIAQDELSMEALGKIPEGKQVKCAVTVPRSLAQHRMLFALLHTVHRAQIEPIAFPTVESLLDALKIATGHVREVKDLLGNIHYVPKSIDFSSMPSDEFRQWLDQAINVILEKILPWIAKTDLEDECYSILGEVGPSQMVR
jgi:hypothetical protein